MEPGPVRKATNREAAETVAAIATPSGEGGIGIVHVTGPGAVDVVSRLFRPRKPLDLTQQSGSAVHYGHLMQGEELLDEVLVRVCRCQESFTGSELVEINCHGGAVSVHRILRCLQQHGVRSVPAADLLEEAVRQGRVDAVQREAMVELLRARSPEAAVVLLDQQRGLLGDTLRELEEALEGLARHSRRAHSRAAIESLQSLQRQCAGRLGNLLNSYALGRRLCHPAKVVIAGRANVGKSTLFNALCRQDRALTSARGGTTRDFVTGQVVLGGLPFELIDTAGIRESLNLIEAESVNVSWEQIATAHLVLLLFDGSGQPTEQDRELVERLRERLVVPVINKSDRGVLEELRALASSFGRTPLVVSAQDGAGVDQVREALVQASGGAVVYGLPTPTLFSERQVALVQKALSALSAQADSPRTPERRRLFAECAKKAAACLAQCRKG